MNSKAEFLVLLTVMYSGGAACKVKSVRSITDDGDGDDSSSSHFNTVSVCLIPHIFDQTEK